MFQSTHSRRVRHYSSLPIAPVFWVSIHALTKSATFITLVLVVGRSLVSIHALTKSATSLHFVISTFRSFQSTHSRRVRRPSSRHSPRVTSSFNPRTHEECDSILPGSTRMPRVSIHALTKSATAEQSSLTSGDIKFQSTHSRRVRQYSAWINKDAKSFNPRTHEECDCREVQRARQLGRFNPRTHEECDLFIPFPFFLPAGFNPRTHEECDITWDYNKEINTKFQSTHSRRVRLLCYKYIHTFIFVSIHALTKSATYALYLPVITIVVSIHALTKSATCMIVNPTNPFDRVSIHALTKSATPQIFLYSTSASFQSTHSRRVRLYHSAVLDLLCGRFQSTHSRRVRRFFEITKRRNETVSIHALTKSATKMFTG